MITKKIKALFQFIEFLHSNIEKFKQYDEVINELHLLDKERSKVRSRKNFADKLKYDEVQAEIKDKIKIIQENIITPIRSKATELRVCNFQHEPLYNWNGVESDIHTLKENFSKDDLPEIFKHKSKYIEFRTQTNCTYFLDIFFSDLDEILKELFDYFKETEQNEFETFETKAIQANDISEAVKLFQQGYKKFTLPIDLLLNTQKVQRSVNEELPPQPTQLDEYIKIRPTLNPDYIDPLYNILKHYFEPTQQAELLSLLQTLGNTKQKLIFKGNANRFTDTFKKIFEHSFITGWQKKDLTNWICSNFKFLHNGMQKDFNKSTTEKSISGDRYHCKNPIIKIENGKISKFDQPHQKKYNKY